MRLEPRRWLAVVALGVLVLAGAVACASDNANAVNIPTATSGDITLVVDRRSYTPNMPVGVTMKNVSKKSYYALDGRTACTFLQLEEYVQARKAWAAVNLCTLGTQPTVRLVSPGANEPFTFAPGNAPTNANQWQSGLYRVSLTYSTKADGSGPTTIAYSAGFVVSG
jgi:hypothetical protein